MAIRPQGHVAAMRSSGLESIACERLDCFGASKGDGMDEDEGMRMREEKVYSEERNQSLNSS